MGDYFADSEDDLRTITTVRMIADYETIVEKVYSDTIDYFDAFSNDAR